MLEIKKNMKKRLTILIALALFIFAPAIADNINSCGVTINSTGTYYVTQNLYSTGTMPCIVVNSSDVTIDCQGYTLYGNGAGDFGIWFMNATSSPGYQERVTIQNCNLQNFERGIIVIGKNLVIKNVTIDGKNIANSVGISITQTDSITVDGVTIINAHTGISATSSNIVFIWNSRLINDRGIYMSGIQQGQIYKTLFNNYINIKVDSVYGTVTATIFDNAFYSTGATIDVSGSHNLQFYIPPSQNTHTCGKNIMGGCVIGGNYWKDYSPNCINNNRDSFCDYGYQIPYTNLYDYYPLAEPQPYLCARLETYSVNMAPTDSKSINWNLAWNSRIAQPQFQVISAPSGISVSFDTSQCNFGLDSAGCTVKVNINTNGVNVGDYSVQVKVSSGDCWYTETIAVHVSSQPCSGSVQLTLNPSSVNPGGTFQAIISGLSNCGGTAYIKDYRGCTSGETLATCQVSGSGCSVSLTAPSNPGTYRYYACFDINLDGLYTTGEYDYKDLTVTTGPTSACQPISSPGTFTLNYDVSANQDVCFPITVSNVVFDCQGHTIYGNGNTYGIFAFQDGVVVKNCNIVGFKTPVLIRSGSVANNTLNGTFSALIVDGSNVEIYNNNLIGKTASVWLNPNASLVKIHDN